VVAMAGSASKSRNGRLVFRRVMVFGEGAIGVRRIFAFSGENSKGRFPHKETFFRIPGF